LNIVWSPTARRQAEAAVAFIANDRPMVAVAWYDGLAERIELLREFPQQGRIVSEWHEDTVREILHRPYRVIYEYRGDSIEILTLSHVRQSLPPDRVEGSL
jgi:plasmid stabilization system protein ParE